MQMLVQQIYTVFNFVSESPSQLFNKAIIVDRNARNLPINKPCKFLAGLSFCTLSTPVFYTYLKF